MKTEGAGLPLVRHLERFGRLTPAEEADVASVVAGAVIRTVRPRVDVIREGDRPHALFVIIAGWAYRHKTLADGRRQIVSLLVPGDFCDLHNDLLDTMDHAIGALTSLRVAEVPHAAIAALMERFPDVGDRLRKQMLVSVAVQREWTVNVGQRSALERLAHLFCEMTLRLRAIGLVHDNSFEFPLTQADMGDALGLTSVHVNRTLQNLRAAGLVGLSGRVLTVPRFAALADAAHFVPDYLHLGEDGGAPVRRAPTTPVFG